MATVVREAPKKLYFGPDHKTLADFAAASNRRAVAWLVLVCLVAFLPGFFTIPPVDRDEARFAQATKQMLEGGGFVDIRFQDEVRYKKPIGIYWLQAAAVKVGEVQKMQLSVYGDGAAMLASQVTADRSGPPYYAVRVWARRGGQWQMAVSAHTHVK